ncbi:MAG TPA: DNA polymerase III subunit gamma/tau [Granulicella sp.]
MAYQVLARKYRPQRFADVVGQDHVTVTLMNALSQQRIAHGYIFSGHRGIGKTTIARILAMALNCRNVIGSPERPTPEPCEICDSCREIRAGNSVDVIEIDAATNRGIDEIRELRDAARYRPARDRFKIYILDEAHQITDAAFNALLKTLEEPPDHIVFMMATTQPEDIPQTVRSRCQHFSFHAVKLVDILGQLRFIATQENIDADDAALSLLAEAGDGSMRDALSIMDQAIASAPVSDGRPILDASQIRELMGAVPNAVFERIFEAVDQNQSAEVMTVANQLLDAGNSPAQLARQCVRYLRNALIARIAQIAPDGTTPDASAAELLQISADEQRRAARTAALFTEEELTRFMQVMLRTFDELGYRQEQRFHFELGLLKLVHLRRLLPVEELLSGIPVAPGSGGTQRGISPPKTTTAKPSALPASEKPAFTPLPQPTTPRRFAEAPAPPTISRIVAPAATVQAPPPPPPPVLMETAPVFPLPEIRVESNAGTITEAKISADLPPAIPAEPQPADEPASDLEISASTEPEPAPPAPLKADRADEITALQQAAIDALSDAKQKSAADALDDATWTLEGTNLTIQTNVSKTMFGITFNPDAERILRSKLPGLKLTLLHGAGASAASKKPRAPRAGSVQAKASEHPIVQRAQSLFNAEIRSVIDLREDN